MDRKRLLIFCLLGPILGLGVLRFVLLSDTLDRFDPLFFLVLAPPAYLVGLLPALAAAGVDQVLWEKGVRFRPLIMLFAGFVLSFVPIFFQIVLFGLWSPMVLLWGILGAVPAAICSWLVGSAAPVSR